MNGGFLHFLAWAPLANLAAGRILNAESPPLYLVRGPVRTAVFAAGPTELSFPIDAPPGSRIVQVGSDGRIVEPPTVRLDGNRLAGRLERWQAVAVAP